MFKYLFFIVFIFCSNNLIANDYIFKLEPKNIIVENIKSEPSKDIPDEEIKCEPPTNIPVFTSKFQFTDLNNLNDKLVVLDTTTGIEWLRLQSTRNKTMNQVISQLETNYKGWRLPTHDEVKDMYTRFSSLYGVTNPNVGDVETRSGVYLNAAQGFVRTFGNSSITDYRHIGMFLDSSGNAKVIGAYSDGYYPYAYYYGLGNNVFRTVSKDYVYYNGQVWGTFLVNDGGLTLSSINNPYLNINNPNSPINKCE